MIKQSTPVIGVKSSQASSSHGLSVEGERENVRPSDLYQIGCKTLMVAAQVVPQTVTIQFQDGTTREIVIRSAATLMIGVFPLDVSLPTGVHPVPPRKVAKVHEPA